MIDVGHRKLHVYCSGKGTPTVVLVAGNGGYSIDWALVQPRIAETTRVCSYDRAGYAWSDPGPADETVEQTIRDLRTLLDAAGERPPYLLVGASIGGIFIRAYQRSFPNDVAGLVFTNSSNRVGRSVNGKISLIWDLTEDEIRSTFPLRDSAKGSIPTHQGEPFDRLPPTLRALRFWLDVSHWKKLEPLSQRPELILSWRREFLREFEETEVGKEPPLGKLPVVVLSTNPIPGEAERQSRDGAAARLDVLSSNCVHILAPGSGYEIHLYQPEILAQALTRCLSAVRSNTSLSIE
jgi:pimeloyl-ACP methyl ester carboxylesterase